MIALFLASAAAQQPPEASVAHPEVPCWTGERTWTAQGERPSEFVVFDTRGDATGVMIEHNRDHFRERGHVVQDYNFLDYRFLGRPELQVRVYLHDPSTVMVAAGGASIDTLGELRAAAGDEVVCYLQKRFGVIETLRHDVGYRPLWRARRR